MSRWLLRSGLLFLALGIIACSGATAAPPSDGGSWTDLDGGRATDLDCGVRNDPRCPASYGTGYFQKPCSPIGLTCAYPGRGDGPGTCADVAMLWCRAASNDGGEDAGVGEWVFAQ